MQTSLAPTVALDRQWRGTIWFERGFEIVEISGWIRRVGDWLMVYGDSDVDFADQRFTAIGVARVIESDVEEYLPLPG